MAQVQQGSEVTVHYKGRLKDGTVFDSSRERGESLSFEVGDEQVIPGFENAVKDMEPGDEKEVTIEPENAYGQRRDDLVFELEGENVPGQPEVDQQLQLKHPSGEMIPVTIVDVSDDGETVTVDANHQLAGKTLTFEIELMDVETGESEDGDSQIITP
ncbi:MAG: peptidylprolyl isomerase [Bacteroidetes bacterium QS_8_64_10]|jgi:peptidylprolyl isomerase/FKBP-type peptidyl-prolyl cis-trans isomerase SlpA|nr:MAG: peptidylprolyl isomerase [Bacteroidetes bacterium QS_8_64_10]